MLHSNAKLTFLEDADSINLDSSVGRSIEDGTRACGGVTRL